MNKKEIIKKYLNRDKNKIDIKKWRNTKVINLNPLILAYIGDSVYDLYIRKYLIDKGICKVDLLQKESIKYVSAKGQAMFLKQMLDYRNHECLSLIYIKGIPSFSYFFIIYIHFI